VQRFRCLKCGTTFREEQPLDGVRIDAKQAAQIVSLICESVGIRAVSRLTGVCQETVLRVLTTAGEHCARLLDAKVRNLEVEQCEIDELYSFVRTRPDNTPHGDTEHGEQYCYLSVDRDSKLIINHLIAKRHGDNARAFLTDLKGRIASRFQLSSDGWPAYTGWDGGVAKVFGSAIDYGSEIKAFGKKDSILANSRERSNRKFNPDVCLWVKRKAHIGNPDFAKINTSRVERLNLSVRTFNRRFTRLTLGYSKTLENHKAAAALFVAHYNFCRVHSATEQTPAVSAGLTDHTWTVAELVLATI